MDVGAAGKGMANDHDVILGSIKFPPCFVRNGYVLEYFPAF